MITFKTPRWGRVNECNGDGTRRKAKTVNESRTRASKQSKIELIANEVFVLPTLEGLDGYRPRPRPKGLSSSNDPWVTEASAEKANIDELEAELKKIQASRKESP